MDTTNGYKLYSITVFYEKNNFLIYSSLVSPSFRFAYKLNKKMSPKKTFLSSHFKKSSNGLNGGKKWRRKEEEIN